MKHARSKAAEDGDPSVVWEPDKVSAARIPVSPKKPSSSPTVLLKERTKERILKKVGKPEGPSCTPSSLVVPAVTDEDLAGKMVESKHEPIFIPESAPDAFKHFEDQVYPQTDIKAWTPYVVKDDSVQNHEKIQVPPATSTDIFPEGTPVELSKYIPALGKVFRQLPVEDSTAINHQAKQVIASLPSMKLDPNSAAAELARLEKSQLKGAKKKD